MLPLLSEQEHLRRQKYSTLLADGVDPYPSASFFSTHSISALTQTYRLRKTLITDVVLAGRLRERRIMGAASFVKIQDSTGQLQLYVHRDSVSPEDDKYTYCNLFKKHMDLGDIIGVSGYMFVTKTGELSLHVTKLQLLAKALRPLPAVKEVKDKGGIQTQYNAFGDAEQRYRQRYVDLVLNKDVRERFRLRSKMVTVIRAHFDDLGCLEVETPVLQPIYGGASARPFVTKHNTLNMQYYLRISNELYLKRLIVGGYDGVYEFAKDFRNEGMSRFHNPEFTLFEVYVAYRDYYWLMDEVENLFGAVAKALHGTKKVTVGEHQIDFSGPWPRYTMFEVIEKFTGVDVSEMDENDLIGVASSLKLELTPDMKYAKILDEIFGKFCEPNLIQPTFITDYPLATSPLAKKHRDDPRLVERFELICNGKEVCNAFSELNDPIDQQKRFEEQQKLAKHGDKEAMMLDHDYIRALSYGMPPTAGLGIGIDRLAMIMTNAASIQEVIFFPQMRPESTD